MAVIRISWILLTAAVLAIGAVYGNAAYPALLAALVIAPAVMTVGNLAVRNKIDVNVQCPVNAAKGKTARVSIRIDNKSRFPVFIVGFNVVVSNRLTGQTVKVRRVTSAMAKKSGAAYVDITGRFCGKLDITVSKVRLYDCFWLIPVRCALSAYGAVTVQPQTFPMSVLLRANISCPDESETYSQEKAGYDVTEVFQLRDYREGDSIRQIHWKLSTKYDRLISRDPSLPITRSVLLFWERRVPNISRVRQDAQAEALISLCRALLAMDVQFTIAWNERAGRCVMQPVRELDDLVALLPRLFSAAAFTDGPGGAELYCGTECAHAFAHVVYLGETVSPALDRVSPYGLTTALVCGGTAEGAPEGIAVHSFAPDACAQALTELEL